MNTITLLLLQTRVESTLIIFALLLVSAIIGYATAWFYSRSVYRRDMKIYKSGSEMLKQEVAIQNEEISKLQQKLIDKNKKLETLSEDLATLNINNASQVSENKLHVRDDLKMISGIGPFIEERLHAMDINSFFFFFFFNLKDI